MGKCKKCGKQRKHLSQRGICDKCREAIQNIVPLQMKTKDGSYYDRWKAGMAKASKKF